MTTQLRQETHQEFVKRMAVERNELSRAVREENYMRAVAIAEQIRDQLLARVRLVGRG